MRPSIGGRMAGQWRLLVSRGGAVVADRVLGPGVLTFGRSPDNAVALDDVQVSRFHAVLTLRDNGLCHLQDVGSKNGTFLADRRIARTVLSPGDRFSLGPFLCEFIADRPPDSGAFMEPTGEAGVDVSGADPRSVDTGPFLGTSRAALAVLTLARRAADTELNLLITGESGSGKGVVARLVHGWSRRAKAPFVVVNCAAIPGELIESELFGHRRGAFTGAVSDRPGKFRTADGGTLFLDEIGDLALPAQAKILRAIEDQEIEPVGEPSPLRVNVRVLAATNHNLEQAVSAARFRADLYHRVSTLSVHVAPLRDRKEDLLVLANWFLAELIDEIPWAQGAAFSSEAVDALLAHDWPGNVRELRNTVAQALVARAGDIIRPEHLRFARALQPVEAAPTQRLAEVETQHIVRALEFHGYNLVKTAKSLGISRSTLRQRMEKLGLGRPTEKG